MKKIPESGYYNSNKFARIFIESLKEIMGKNGLNAVLNYAGLSSLVDNYPPDNMDKAFDFAHFSMINIAMEEMYGTKGGRGLGLRAGRITFEDVLKDYGAMAGVGDLAFRVLPLQSKIRIGLQAMAKIFSEKSDQISYVEEEEDHYKYIVERCPICWGREDAEHPVCFYMIGIIQEGLKWVSGGKEFRVNESKCSAMGHDHCEFVIFKKPLE
ncbi:MAG: 4-vinyl reductase [Anaerolineales bacterium]